MFKAGARPPNRCEDPTHVRSEVNGRCKTCRLITRKLKRQESRKAQPRRKAPTFSGNPCRTCGSTTRYVQSEACVGCQRRYFDRHSAAANVLYHIQPEFTRWIKSRLPECEHV